MKYAGIYGIYERLQGRARRIAGIGAGIYKSYEEAFINFNPIKKTEPSDTKLYDDLYHAWKAELEKHVTN